MSNFLQVFLIVVSLTYFTIYIDNFLVRTIAAVVLLVAMDWRYL